MTDFKFFIELNYQKQIPLLKYKLNGNLIDITSNELIEKEKTFEKRIVSCQGNNLQKYNTLEILVFFCESDNDIDFVNIKQIVIDGHYLDSSFISACEFYPNMSKQWIKKMLKSQLKVNDVFLKKIKLEVNGTWKLNFFTPLWKFIINNTNSTTT
jgi:hypothetical protein